MKKWACTVRGYVYEGENPPEKCPQCDAPASKLKEQEVGKMVWACGHEIGVTQGSLEDIMMDLRANFEGECSKVDMYPTMSRVVHREGYPKIGMYWAQAAFERAEHAVRFAELLGEVVTFSAKKNLEIRAVAENGATAGRLGLAKGAKALNLDTIHNTVHEMAKDEARHGKAFRDPLQRYSG